MSDLEITKRLNKGQTVVCQVRGKLIENQELITQHHNSITLLYNSCGRFI